MIFLLLALGALDYANAAATVFDQDPLCAKSPKTFSEELNKARPIHLKYAQLKGAAEAQSKWFAAVSSEMNSICESDAKFALELAKKDRSAITGQCKPAAEAALADQEVLEHSEKSLKRLQGRPEEYLLKGVKNGTESLWAIYERDYYRVSVDALDEMEVPRAAACELRWIYPRSFLKMKIPFVGCTEAPSGVKIGESDKKDPGILAQMISRYKDSIEYNIQRRNNALTTALASKARYEACIAQNPGTENLLVKGKSGSGPGDSHVVPQGTRAKNGSDITGIKEDENKQK